MKFLSDRYDPDRPEKPEARLARLTRERTRLLSWPRVVRSRRLPRFPAGTLLCLIVATLAINQSLLTPTLAPLMYFLSGAAIARIV